jgi:hypothetical protein
VVGPRVPAAQWRGPAIAARGGPLCGYSGPLCGLIDVSCRVAAPRAARPNHDVATTWCRYAAQVSDTGPKLFYETQRGGLAEISIDSSQKVGAEFYRCEISNRILKARPVGSLLCSAGRITAAGGAHLAYSP